MAPGGARQGEKLLGRRVPRRHHATVAVVVGAGPRGRKAEAARFEAVMLRFARMRSELRRQGNLIPDFDLLIAATALEHDLILMTRNTRHFARIAGLRLYGART